MASGGSRASKSEETLREELAGFPDAAILSVLRFVREGTRGSLVPMIRHVLGHYLPRGSTTDLAAASGDARLREDLGLDSLALSEAVFKLDDLTGVTIETGEAAGLRTLAELEDFLARRLLHEAHAPAEGEQSPR